MKILITVKLTGKTRLRIQKLGERKRRSKYQREIDAQYWATLDAQAMRLSRSDEDVA